MMPIVDGFIDSVSGVIHVMNGIEIEMRYILTILVDPMLRHVSTYS